MVAIGAWSPQGNGRSGEFYCMYLIPIFVLIEPILAIFNFEMSSYEI